MGLCSLNGESGPSPQVAIGVSSGGAGLVSIAAMSTYWHLFLAMKSMCLPVLVQASILRLPFSFTITLHGFRTERCTGSSGSLLHYQKPKLVPKPISKITRRRYHE